jgi:AcrR family transcriptional regulator
METELGRKILDFGIDLIDNLGFEKFTFKKLATAINSTEASIYRYFENKHKLLLYLVSWYWTWLEYLINYQTNNIDDPKRKLRLVVEALANAGTYDPNFAHIDEAALHRIVVAESSKAFLTKDVDGENEMGLFQGYKSLAGKIAGFLAEINPGYPYPKALAVTAIEASRMQIYFAQHFPSLTELELGNAGSSSTADFLEQLMLKSLTGGK